MSEEKSLKLVRLKDSYDDIVGVVTYHQEHITIERPLVVDVETFYDEGRQILSIREYLPQSIVMIKEVEFTNDQILFVTPVREEFKEQYEEVAKFFYDQQPSMMGSKKKKERPDTEKIISLVEALREKKDKPVH